MLLRNHAHLDRLVQARGRVGGEDTGEERLAVTCELVAKRAAGTATAAARTSAMASRTFATICGGDSFAPCVVR